MARLEGIDARVAHRLGELRNAHGLTHEELAERAGYSARFIGKLERLESRGTVATWDALAKALGVPLAELFVAAGSTGRGTAAKEATARYGPSEAQVTVLTSLARSLDRKGLATLIDVARALSDAAVRARR